MRGLLVATEAALAVVLLAGAGLMVRTVTSLRAVDPGFDPVGVATLRLSPPTDRYPPGPELEAYYERASRELGRLLGVTSVGAIQFLPMTSGGWWETYRTEETRAATEAEEASTAMRVVRPGYFETMRVRLVAGRKLTDEDFREGAPLRVLVNERLVAETGGGLVGRSIYLNDGETPAEVVGVVADVRQSDLRQATHAETYVPFSRVPWQRMHLVMRVEGEVEPVARAARAAVASVDPSVSIAGPLPMPEVVARTTARTRLVAALLSVFGVVGLILGGIGVYGVAAQSVTERRSEIGIRLALGAEGGSVAARTIVEGLGPVALGLVLGILASGAGARLLEGLVFGVSTRDWATLSAAPLVLLLVAFVALATPALRAARVDPRRTLRDE